MIIVKLNLFDYDENYITSFVLKLTQLQKLERDKTIVTFRLIKDFYNIKLGFPDDIVKKEVLLQKIWLERSSFNYGFSRFK